MSRRRAGLFLLIAATAAAAVAAAGCDRDTDGAGPTAPQATTSPSTYTGRSTTARSAATTTGPATTQAAPAESMISIDGNLVLFPAAKMRVDESEGRTVVRLFSDDPKGAALDENYEGNSFYLQVDVDPEDARDLGGVRLTYSAPSSERDDTPYGIFLEGRRWILQPQDVRVAFEGAGSPLDVQLSGTFLMFDSKDDTAKPTRAQVVARLSATMQTRR